MSDNVRRQWVDARSKALASGSVTYLVKCAEDRGIPINDYTSISNLAKLVAEREWNGRSDLKLAEETDYPPADVTGVPFYVENDKYKGQNMDLVAHGDEFNAMESGPQDVEADRPGPANREQLKRDIMERWIGMTGGMDWHNGPTAEAAVARRYGAALAATLDAVLDEEGFIPPGFRPQTSSGYFIYEVLLPEFLERFLAKNADYGDQHRTGLGVGAEYVGIHRKVEKLKRALWDGREMNGEGAREMLFDLIGQCFIVLDLIANQEARDARLL